LNNKRSDRSRSPPISHSSYGITSESFNKKKQSSSSSSKSNGFIPDEETKKFYDKSTDNETGFWTSEDYTFRDMLAKDVREEIEDDIASKNSDEESEEDPEIAEYADRADMDDEDNEQKKTIVERVIPIKKDEEKKKDIKSDQILINQKT
jgi:hypothetical protein